MCAPRDLQRSASTQGHRPSMSTRIRISAFLLIVALAAACSSRREPEPSPQAYREAVTAFYVGVSAMQTTQEVLAREKFDRVVALVPQEPAGWANLGLLLLRQQELEQGAQHLARAATLAPDSAEIQRLQALAEEPARKPRRSDRATGAARWSWIPDDLEAAYALALETERQGGSDERRRGAAHARAAASHGATTWRRVSSTCAIAAKRGDQAALDAGDRAARRRRRGRGRRRRRSS